MNQSARPLGQQPSPCLWTIVQRTPAVAPRTQTHGVRNPNFPTSSMRQTAQITGWSTNKQMRIRDLDSTISFAVPPKLTLPTLRRQNQTFAGCGAHTPTKAFAIVSSGLIMSPVSCETCCVVSISEILN